MAKSLLVGWLMWLYLVYFDVDFDVEASVVSVIYLFLSKFHISNRNLLFYILYRIILSQPIYLIASEICRYAS